MMPNVLFVKDVREITVEMMREWKFKFPGLRAIHIWGGFPCIDLSSVKAFRKNLAGPKTAHYSSNWCASSSWLGRSLGITLT